MGTTALLTDRYELTMLQSGLRSGAAERDAVFEVFARGLPGGRRYGVVCGTGRLLEAIEGFCFDEASLAYLRTEQVVNDDTLRWLADYRFTGDVDGYAEGECFFPGSPILTVRGSFAQAVLLETLVLSVLNHDAAVAAAASRMTCAAGGRPCIEMGSRRTHEEAAVAAARAAYVAGFAATSNLMAGARYDIPTTGTSAHAFTLVHDSEHEAFTAQVGCLGAGTTLLVDTYDVAAGVRTAIEVAGRGLGAVRLDSGDLLALTHAVRAQLDELGAHDTKIVVTSDLDEYAIAALASAPAASYGVGTSLVTGSGAPTAGLVYKLVEVDGRPVAKKSTGKPSRGGRKWAARRLDQSGRAEAEVVLGREPRSSDGRSLIVPLVRNGRVVGREPLATARERHAASRGELPITAYQLSRGEPAITTEYEEIGS